MANTMNLKCTNAAKKSNIRFKILALEDKFNIFCFGLCNFRIIYDHVGLDPSLPSVLVYLNCE
jgi:hypothetical protein